MPFLPVHSTVMWSMPGMRVQVPLAGPLRVKAEFKTVSSQLSVFTR